MLLTPTPGTDRAQLLDTLRSVRTNLANIRSRSHIPGDLLTYYFVWATESARLLRHHVRAEDLDRLVLTRRYWALQGSVAADVNGVVDLEISERNDVLTETISDLEAETRRWTQRPGHIVVPDTSVFCHHADKLEDIDFAGMLGLRETPVRIVLPVLVLDELDSLKQARGRGHIRWRAASSLAVLDRVLDDSGHGLLREEDIPALGRGESPREQVTVEILFDPPGHTRLPVNDDELIDRALAVQVLAARPLTFVTFDTGQSMRARTAGLKVEKLVRTPGRSRRGTPSRKSSWQGRELMSRE